MALTAAVVIPVFDEAATIESCLEDVLRHGFDEVVVVDGGSRDDTVARARQLGVRVVVGVRGRGAQQNLGAQETSSDILLFLHADARLPRAARQIIEETLQRPDTVAGAFRVKHLPVRWTGRARAALLKVADLRSRLAALPYGDQGIFLRRTRFHEVGGFPEIDLMEDLELSRRLARRGRIAVVADEVLVSGRRFESATLYQCLLMNTFPSLYRLGVSPQLLARLYGNPR